MEKDVDAINSTIGELRSPPTLEEEQKRTKIVINTIENVEYHYPQFIQDINLYTVRSAKLRDSGDNLARSIHQYAESESPVIRQGLIGFSRCFSTVQDHRNALVNRLEGKVVGGFSLYEMKCKQAKVDVDLPCIAHKQELNMHKSFERAKLKSQHYMLAKAEAKFKRASDEAQRKRQTQCNDITQFEREKIRDLKCVFGELLLSEMLFYSKALELYTRGYQDLMSIDEEEDVEQLQSSMNNTARSNYTQDYTLGSTA